MAGGIYIALSGGIAKFHDLELIANNLANSNTPGFKKEEGTFDEYLTHLRKPEAINRSVNVSTDLMSNIQVENSLVELDEVRTNFSQGTLYGTKRNLDVSIHGNGFFETFTPQGVRYTRQGNFNISPDGILVTANGFPVLSRQYSDEIKPEERFIKVNSSQFNVTPDGFIEENGKTIAQIEVKEFKNPHLLEKIGNSYFKNTGNDNISLLDEKKSKLQQGFLESSNVNPILEITKLIEATRAYETHLHTIKTFQEIDTRSVNDIAHLK